MPPITVVFVVSGLAVWAIGLSFLGIGATPSGEVDAPNPMVTVGWITLVAGVVDLVQAAYIIISRPAGADPSVVLAGIIMFYAAIFTLLGIALVAGLDLRPVANVSVAVAIAPMFWWKFFNGSWMFHSILIVWLVAFLATTATIYGKLPGKALGAILTATAVYTFLTPAIILALGHSIP
ncbi:MAG TPA: hypothetical protein VGL39_09090 [Jatrophihabitantaceae bacterium]|jgi:hypothetical protein